MKKTSNASLLYFFPTIEVSLVVRCSEERRLQNIRQNQALLAELDLKSAAEGLGLPPSRAKGIGKRKGKTSIGGAQKPRPVQPRKKLEAKPKAESVVPRRQSTRLAHAIADANETSAQKARRLVSAY
jgi:hypothetical protein